MFFEKIAKFHEIMPNMDDADFGLALRYVRLAGIFMNFTDWEVLLEGSSRRDSCEEIFEDTRHH